MGLNMKHNILVCYKSTTGFTKRYAEMISGETGCTLMNSRDVTARIISQYDTIVFGGRLHAGVIDGLKKIRKLITKSGGKTFVVFATGAMPLEAEETIQQMWENNLTPEELRQIPHFYMPGGLCYEKMPLPDKIMMKAFASVMKRQLRHKENKTPMEQSFEENISTSYDISSKEYVKPLVSFLKDRK